MYEMNQKSKLSVSINLFSQLAEYMILLLFLNILYIEFL